MSAGKFEVNEERLTAYVLGEVGEAEKEAIERALERDPLLQQEANDIRTFCRELSVELDKEPSPALTAEQKRELDQAVPQSLANAWRQRFSWQVVAPAIAVAAGATFLVLKDDPRFESSFDPMAGGSWNEAEEVQFVQAVEEKAAKESANSTSPKTLPKNNAQGKAPGSVPGKAKVPAGKFQLNFLGPTDGKPLALGTNPTAQPNMTGVPYNLVGRGSQAPRRYPGAGGGLEGADIGSNTEAYDRIVDNPFKSPTQDPLSTFSVDVDTASWSNIRRFVNSGQLPPKDAVRIEEMINYFNYRYQSPSADRPFKATVEVSSAPWAPQHRFVRIGIKGKEIPKQQRPASNLVFLIDVSGSMSAPQKLPLLRRSMKMMVEQLGERDRVAMVVYAGASGLVLPSTPLDQKQKVLDALDRLQAGGSTNGGAGIELAYKTAQSQFIKGGINRVILATDGDFNVGTTNQGSLTRMIEDKAKTGVFLSVLGFGMGNYKDSTLEKLADKGNGNYAYIDTAHEAKKVLVEQIGGTLMTIAKDVKMQVEFNPAEVNAYRLIGYENRILAHQDFNDDSKDAGDIGAGHTVTALYEIVPKGVAFTVKGVDPLKYQTPKTPKTDHTGELMTLKLRYKQPSADKSSLIVNTIRDHGRDFDQASGDLKFAAAVASLGMVLRNSEHKGGSSFQNVLSWGREGLGEDSHGYRKEFLDLVEKAAKIK